MQKFHRKRKFINDNRRMPENIDEENAEALKCKSREEQEINESFPIKLDGQPE